MNNYKSVGKKITMALIASICIVCAFFIALTTINAPTSTNEINNTTELQSLFKAYFKAEKEGSIKNEWNDVVLDAIPENSVNGSITDEGYIETTDNQVAGVIEADLMKRSDKYIYYLNEHTIEIYDINKENTKKIGSFTPTAAKKSKYVGTCEFYLSQDCKIITMILEYEGQNKELCFDVININVEDPTNIKEIKTLTFAGQYNSSRLVDDQLLIVSEFYVESETIDYKNEETYMPYMIVDGKAQLIGLKDIIAPSHLTNTTYTVLTNTNADTLEIYAQKAMLSYLSDVYVTKEHAYLARVDSVKNSEKKTQKTITEIKCFSFDKEKIEVLGSVTVDGYIKDQYSMDEHNGVFRVVTTTNSFESSRIETWYNTDGLSSNLMRAWGNSNADLYCIDTNDWSIKASVLQFAPPYEEVQSVRFDGGTAYVCTSIEMSDPVYFFDLSDLNNITYKDTGTIEGYSTSLINFGNGYLVGIGVAGWNSLKVEVYKESEDGVVAVSDYTLSNTYYSRDYKAYYVDRENQLIGLGIGQYERAYHTYYVVLQLNDEQLVEISRVGIDGNTDLMRSVYIDGYVYIFSNKEFKVEKI